MDGGCPGTCCGILWGGQCPANGFLQVVDDDRIDRRYFIAQHKKQTKTKTN